MKREKKTESTSKMDHIENLLSFVHAKLEGEIKDREQSDTWWQRDIEKLEKKTEQLEAKIKQLEAKQ